MAKKKSSKTTSAESRPGKTIAWLIEAAPHVLRSSGRALLHCGPMAILLVGVLVGMGKLWVDALSGERFRVIDGSDALGKLENIPPDAALQLRHLAKKVEGASLLSPRLPAIAEEIFASNPWVASTIEFRRALPNALYVDFTLRSPVAQVYSEGQYLRVDGAGVRLPTPDPTKDNPSLPVVRCLLSALPQPGEAWDSEELHDALSVLRELQRSVLAEEVHVRHIFVSRDSYMDPSLRKQVTRPRIDLYTDTGVLVRWGTYNGKGRAEELLTSEKIDLLRRVLAHAGELGRGDIVDIRTRAATYSSGAAMRTPN